MDLKGLLLVGVIMLALLGFSWVVTCIFVKLITLCFGYTFTFSVATGIWLILLLLRLNFKTKSK